jgi:hypothetical protein
MGKVAGVSSTDEELCTLIHLCFSSSENLLFMKNHLIEFANEQTKLFEQHGSQIGESVNECDDDAYHDSKEYNPNQDNQKFFEGLIGNFIKQFIVQSSI